MAPTPADRHGSVPGTRCRSESCRDSIHSRPLPLRYRESYEDYRFGDLLTYQVEVDDRLAAQEPFTTLGRTITQADFPAIMAAMREQNREEFGPKADRPD